MDDYYSSIYNTLKVYLVRSKIIRIDLNENNSLFMDIEAVQKSMVTLYNFTLAGVTGPSASLHVRFWFRVQI